MVVGWYENCRYQSNLTSMVVNQDGGVSVQQKNYNKTYTLNICWTIINIISTITSIKNFNWW